MHISYSLQPLLNTVFNHVAIAVIGQVGGIGKGLQVVGFGLQGLVQVFIAFGNVKVQRWVGALHGFAGYAQGMQQGGFVPRQFAGNGGLVPGNVVRCNKFIHVAFGLLPCLHVQGKCFAGLAGSLQLHALCAQLNNGVIGVKLHNRYSLAVV